MVLSFLPRLPLLPAIGVLQRESAGDSPAASLDRLQGKHGDYHETTVLAFEDSALGLAEPELAVDRLLCRPTSLENNSHLLTVVPEDASRLHLEPSSLPVVSLSETEVEIVGDAFEHWVVPRIYW